MLKIEIKYLNDTYFAYAIGRIRALEKRMIPYGIFLQYAEIPLQDFLKNISEIGYTGDLFESISNEKKSNYNWLSKIINRNENYKNLLSIFILKEDCYNFKLYFKSKIAGEKNFKLQYNPAGFFTYEKINSLIEMKPINIIYPNIIKTYLKKNLENVQSPSLIENLIDKMYFEIVLNIIKKLKIDFLKYYFEEYIDLLNIENIIRFKILERDFEFFKNFYFVGGLLQISDLQEIYNQKIEDIPGILKHRDFYQNLNYGIEYWIKNQNFSVFEREKDNYLLSIIKKAKYMSFGVEPIIAFLLGKEIEYKNLWIIYNGKNVKLKNETIKELLRETYV